MKPTGPTLFVAEDTPLYQQLIRKMLEPVPADAIFFATGESLLLQLPFARPDMAILDYNLEGVLTGLETLQAMRRHCPQVYAILFSTCTDLQTAENFDRFGPFDFVEKSPAGLYLLHQKVVQALSRFS